MFTNEHFAFLAEKYMDTLYRVAYSYTKSHADAEDVTQDVLIQLYRTDKVFESETHLKHWLIRVTVNQCKMLFRAPGGGASPSRTMPRLWALSSGSIWICSGR